MKAMKFQPFEGDQSASKDTKAINVFRAHHSLCLGLGGRGTRSPNQTCLGVEHGGTI